MRNVRDGTRASELWCTLHRLMMVRRRPSRRSIHQPRRDPTLSVVHAHLWNRSSTVQRGHDRAVSGLGGATGHRCSAERGGRAGERLCYWPIVRGHLRLRDRSRGLGALSSRVCRICRACRLPSSFGRPLPLIRRRDVRPALLLCASTTQGTLLAADFTPARRPDLHKSHSSLPIPRFPRNPILLLARHLCCFFPTVSL